MTATVFTMVVLMCTYITEEIATYVRKISVNGRNGFDGIMREKRDERGMRGTGTGPGAGPGAGAGRCRGVCQWC